MSQVIELRLDVGDLADTRFAISPLFETVMSLRVPLVPTYFVLQRAWWERVQGELDGIDMDLLAALVGARRWVPDFLTPRPETPVPVFEAELAQVRDTPPEKIAPDIAAAHLGTPPANLPLDRPAYLRDRIADTLEAYWQAALAPHWPRMRGVLEADMLYRAQRLAQGGARGLFADLHPAVRWADGVLRLDASVPGGLVEITGRGLCISPSLFVNSLAYPIDTAEPPSIAYPARGIATLWSSPPPDRPEALTALLGRRKAELLTCLDRPASTTDLARRLDVTPGAVSQSLTVLLNAGLLSRARVGRVVLYARTDLGEQLSMAGPLGLDRRLRDVAPKVDTPVIPDSGDASAAQDDG